MKESRPNPLWRRLGEFAYKRSPMIRRAHDRSFYELVSLLAASDQRFMNYGYADLNGDGRIRLAPEDEPERYQIQMYHHVASQIDLRGLDVLEVGSGRGGGAAYVASHLGPRHMTGVDLSWQAIRFCRKEYHVPGLEFVQGNAEKLEFRTDTFDAVLNVESSHCYTHMERFFAEVVRVLRPGGHFLYADILFLRRVPSVLQELKSAGLELSEQQDITAGAMKALELDDARKMEGIKHRAPRVLHRSLEEFGSTQSSDNYRRLCTGDRQYICCLLQKPGMGN